MKGKTEAVTVIIPAYNEEESIYTTIKNVEKILTEAGIDFEIIVVDDGSKDKTLSIAKEAGADVISHKKNLGYGASLKTGISYANHDIIIITDADGTYPAEYIPEMIEKLKDADMVVGARIGQNVNIPFLRRPAKWFLKELASYITGERILDLNSGLRAFRRECVEQYFHILPDKFSFTTTITVAMLCDGYSVVYIPINYYKRAGKSKIVPWDFFNFATLVIRLSMLFNPLKVFIPVSFASILLGVVKAFLDILFAFKEAEGFLFASLFTQEVISPSALIFFIAGLQILLVGMMADGIIRKFGQHLPRRYKSVAVKFISHLKTPKKNQIKTETES